MPIIANSEAPSEYPAEAYEKADQMRELMNRDLDEFQIADLVRAFDGGDCDMQLATWELLTVPERRAWHKFYGMRLRKN